MSDLNTTAGTVGAPPSHYHGTGGIDNFDVWDAYEMDAYSANAFKYLARWDKKGSPRNDLKKALHYVQETRNRVLHRGKHIAIPLPKLRPGQAADAFALTGEIHGAVVSLLLYRLTYQHPGGYLDLAEEQILRAIDELPSE